MRAKYQDNLENMQWFKSFFEHNYAGQAYDPILRRSKGRGADTTSAFALDAARRGPVAAEGGDARGSRAGAAEGRANAAGVLGASATRRGVPGPLANSLAAGVGGAGLGKAVGSGGGGGGGGGGAVASPDGGGGARGGARASASAGGGGASAAAVAALTAQLARATERETELSASVEALEKERDFYFGKLRDVEIMLQSYDGPDRATVDALFKILYATDDADFVAVGGAEAPAATAT